MIMDLENLTTNQKQEFPGGLMKRQGNLAKKPGK